MYTQHIEAVETVFTSDLTMFTFLFVVEVCIKVVAVEEGTCQENEFELVMGKEFYCVTYHSCIRRKMCSDTFTGTTVYAYRL